MESTESYGQQDQSHRIHQWWLELCSRKIYVGESAFNHDGTGLISMTLSYVASTSGHTPANCYKYIKEACTKLLYPCYSGDSG